MNALLSAIQHFEMRAKSAGVTSLSSAIMDKIDPTTPIDSKSKLTTMVEERKLALDELYKEAKRIADNARAETLS